MSELTIVLDAQLKHDKDCIEFLAICDKFDMVDADHIPFYEWGVVRSKDLSISVDSSVGQQIEIIPRRLVVQ